MSKNLIEEFKNASSMEKFNTLASIFTISGVSLLTIFNAIGGITLIQLAVSLIYGGLVLLVVILLSLVTYSILYYFSSVMPSIVTILFSITVGIVLLGVFLYSIYIGIDLIKSFEE